MEPADTAATGSQNPANDDPGKDNAAGVAPLTHSILSQAVMTAIGQTDPKLAFDMMLVNEHLTAQDAANRSMKEEIAFLKETLAKQTREQSEMFHYFHEKTDAHMAQIAELERALTAAQEEKENIVAAAKDELEKEQRDRAAERDKAQEELLILREELRQVHAFVEAKHEMEARTRELEMQLDAQRASFQTRMQDLERNNIMEQARTKQELLKRMQAAKAELMLRTHDQVASTTHRTLLENEHFTQELAFQSRETEKLLERLDEAQQEAAILQAKNKVLETNERLMAKKNRYYQKILVKLQQPKFNDDEVAIQLQLESPKAKNNVNSDTAKQQINFLSPEDHAAAANLEVELNEEKEKRVALEGQLQRALEWLRVFQRERQFLLSQQDEVVQFLYRALDEAAEKQHQRKTTGTDTMSPTLANTELSVASRETNLRVEELLELAPTTTTMESFGRRVLVARPALDELSSTDFREVLLFLLEKLHLYQARIAAVYPVSSCIPSVTSPNKQQREMLERQLGVELPPITGVTNVNGILSPSPLKSKRRMFAHVAAAVDAGNMAWLGLPKAKPVASPQPPQAPLSPQLLAMATNQFNFVTTITKPASPAKKRYQSVQHTSHGKSNVVSPPRKIQPQTPIKPLPWSKDETISPWVGTASTASIPEWKPSTNDGLE